MKTKTRVCPAENAPVLDNGLRKFIQNPQKILSPYIKEGMTAVDIGCGPGFFTLEMARLVGEEGRVIAVDLQKKMLEKLMNKVKQTSFEKTIKPHLADAENIGINEKADFVLLFYMLHEVPDTTGFIKEIYSFIKSGGLILYAEPKFHVTKKDFEKFLGVFEKSGFSAVNNKKIFLSRSRLFYKK